MSHFADLHCVGEVEPLTSYAISISMVAVGTQLVVAVADRVPAFDVSRSCKLDVAATTGLSVDQSLKNCVNDENRAHTAPTTASIAPAPAVRACLWAQRATRPTEDALITSRHPDRSAQSKSRLRQHAATAAGGSHDHDFRDICSSR